MGPPGKMSLSMRDADQKTGADLNPQMRLPGQPAGGGGSMGLSELRSNPTRGAGEGEKRRREQEDEDEQAARPLKRLTSPEKFEAQQLIASGVLDVRDYPQFDPNVGMLNVEETREEVAPHPACSSSSTAAAAAAAANTNTTTNTHTDTNTTTSPSPSSSSCTASPTSSITTAPPSSSITPTPPSPPPPPPPTGGDRAQRGGAALPPRTDQAQTPA